MIANEGYFPLSILLDDQYWVLQEQARHFLSKTCNSVLSLTIHRPNDIAQGWVFDFCSDALFLTDGIGRPKRIDPNLVRSSSHFVDLWDQRDRLRDEGLPIIPAELSRRMSFCEPLAADLADKFNGIAEKLSKEIDHEAQKLLADQCQAIFDGVMYEQGYTRPLLFVESGSFQVSLELFDYLAAIENFDLPNHTSSGVFEHAKNLRKFDGYFLVTTDAKAQSNWSSFCASVASDGIRKITESFANESDEVKKGRPRKQEMAHRLYRIAFPDGRGDVPWKKVEAIIYEDFGESVSAQTIRTAIKNSEKGDK